MKKVACVFFELEEGETVQDVINKFGDGIKEPAGIVKLKRGEKCWREKLKKLLNDLGEDTSMLGYSTMFDIVEYVENNPKYKEHFLVKDLYVPVMKKRNRTYCQIERTIRSMIDRIYKNNSVEYVDNVLGITEGSYERMTNSKFMALIIDKVL